MWCNHQLWDIDTLSSFFLQSLKYWSSLHLEYVRGRKRSYSSWVRKRMQEVLPQKERTLIVFNIAYLEVGAWKVKINGDTKRVSNPLDYLGILSFLKLAWQVKYKSIHWHINDPIKIMPRPSELRNLKITKLENDFKLEWDFIATKIERIATFQVRETCNGEGHEQATFGWRSVTSLNP